ncbi:Hypothetical protein POVN_LOCUS691 [uncultured virus]|nr:Hypothetical protein POVN_LOCUS691 [uncultured virus]
MTSETKSDGAADGSWPPAGTKLPTDGKKRSFRLVTNNPDIEANLYRLRHVEEGKFDGSTPAKDLLCMFASHFGVDLAELHFYVDAQTFTGDTTLAEMGITAESNVFGLGIKTYRIEISSNVGPNKIVEWSGFSRVMDVADAYAAAIERKDTPALLVDYPTASKTLYAASHFQKRWEQNGKPHLLHAVFPA